MAERVVRLYATHDVLSAALPSSRCASLGIDDERCRALNHAIEYEDHLSTNIEFISEAERGDLSNAGFTDEFVSRLAGVDGRRLLHERVKWLGRNCLEKRFRFSAREYMLIELEWKKEYAASAVPNLIKLLDDRRMAVRAMAVLGEIGPLAAPALPKLIKIGEKIGFDDFTLANVLSSIDPDGRIVLPHVFDWLKKRQPYSNDLVNLWLPQRLSIYGVPAVPYLMEIIDDQHKYMAEAIETIGLIGAEARDAVPFLSHKLEDPDLMFEYKRQIVVVLGNMGAVEAIPYILSTLKDSCIGPMCPNAEPDYETVMDVYAPALAGMGLPALEAVITAYRDGRRGYLDNLIVPVASEIGRLAIPTLIALLEDRDKQLQFTALLAIRNIGDKAIEAIPYLISFIEKKAEHGYKYKRQIDTMEDWLNYRRQIDKETAGEALAKMGPDAITQISRALERNDSETRQRFIFVLGGMKGSHLAALKLVELSNDDDPLVRSAAMRAIRDVEVGDKKVVDAVIYGLMDTSEGVVREALNTLWSLVEKGVPARDAVPLLERISSNESFHPRERSLSAKLREKIESKAL